MRVLPPTAALVLVLMSSWPAGSQQPPTVADMDRRIAELNRELEQARSRAAQLEQDQSRQVAYLGELGTQISKLEQLLAAYTTDIRRLNTRVGQLQDDMEALDRQMGIRREAVARHVVTLYKYGRVRLVEMVLGSNSFAQGVRRLKGFTIVARRQQQDVDRLADSRREVSDARAEVATHLATVRQREQASRRERQQLDRTRQRTQQVIAALQQDQQKLQQALAQAEAELARLIEEKAEMLRRQRAAGLPPNVTLGGFETLRGRLRWPLDGPGGGGRVVRGFGRHRGVDNTTTTSPGIDIMAPGGSTRIVAVHHAVIVHIGWIAFMGTVILLDHGDDFMTLYANAEGLRLEMGDPVPAGFALGTVGRALRPVGDEPDGHLLRFGVYQAGQAQDPLPWLGGQR
jgi:murein hydrolase activator